MATHYGIRNWVIGVLCMAEMALDDELCPHVMYRLLMLPARSSTLRCCLHQHCQGQPHCQLRLGDPNSPISAFASVLQLLLLLGRQREALLLLLLCQRQRRGGEGRVQGGQQAPTP